MGGFRGCGGAGLEQEGPWLSFPLGALSFSLGFLTVFLGPHPFLFSSLEPTGHRLHTG